MLLGRTLGTLDRGAERKQAESSQAPALGNAGRAGDGGLLIESNWVGVLMEVIAYTDGSANVADRRGGWGVVLQYGGVVKELSGSRDGTTNNLMELMAVYHAIDAIKKPCTLVIHTDSQDVIGWLTGEFRQSNLRIRAQCDEIKLLAEVRKVTLRFVKVVGHSGDPYNERADLLATMARTNGGKHAISST